MSEPNPTDFEDLKTPLTQTDVKMRIPAIQNTRNIMMAITLKGKIKLCGASSSLSMAFVFARNSNTFVNFNIYIGLFCNIWHFST